MGRAKVVCVCVCVRAWYVRACIIYDAYDVSVYKNVVCACACARVFVCVIHTCVCVCVCVCVYMCTEAANPG
jgi:hypothetical protein